MSYKTEELAKNSYKITIEVDAQEFEKACEKAYQKNKGKIQIQGFRKGKAPTQQISLSPMHMLRQPSSADLI